MNRNDINRINLKFITGEVSWAEKKIADWLEYYRLKNSVLDIKNLKEELRLSNMLDF